MRMYDIIEKKRNGCELTEKEISFFTDGFTSGEIPDYQAAALVMAICLNGMSEQETMALTLNMRNSGEIIDLSEIDGIKVDKHSTGGVGDKVTLIAAPIAAACGVPIAKMSGRGLGFTGGTADKLESIEGFRVNLSNEEFISQAKEIGIAVCGQTKSLCPADKKLYALRDVTATVDSLPLIASSIMCKKLAAGGDKILLDVTFGSGAFMKNISDAEKLADAMVKIGTSLGKETVAVITNMDCPLGRAVGNRLEVREAIEMLGGTATSDLWETALLIAANMIYLGEKANSLEEARALAEKSIKDGSALQKLRQLVIAQGGDVSYIDNPEKLEAAPVAYEIKADTCGYINRIDALAVGKASVTLGAGREKEGDKIDFGAGIYLNKKPKDCVFKGDTVLTLYSGSKEKCEKAAELLKNAITIR